MKKKNYKRLALTTILGLTSLSALSQSEGAAFTSTGRAVATTFVKDYEATGINPANLAWGTGNDNTKLSIGLMEFGASGFSSAITRDQLIDPEAAFDRLNFFKKFNEAGTSMHLDAAPFSIAYMDKNIGGFAFSVSDRFQFYAKIGGDLADIMVNGWNSSYFDQLQVFQNGSLQTIANDPSVYNLDSMDIRKGISSALKPLENIINETNINLTYTRQFTFSYGRYFYDNGTLTIGGGIGLKYIQGYGTMNIGVDEDGKVNSFVALSDDFGVDVENKDFGTFNAGSAPFFTPVGEGFGGDIGINATYRKKFKFGLAVTNIGQIDWSENAYTIKDTTFTEIESGGFESANILDEIGQVVTEGELFEFEKAEELIVKLPTTLRIGASMAILDEMIHVGADVIIPLNDAPGSYEKPILALGGDIRPVNFIELSLGFNYGGNTQERLNLPLGITFHAGENSFWEAGIASRDLVTWIYTGTSPNVSATMGFLRFNI